MFFKVQINIEKEEWVLKGDTVYTSYKTNMIFFKKKTFHTKIYL